MSDYSWEVNLGKAYVRPILLGTNGYGYRIINRYLREDYENKHSENTNPTKVQTNENFNDLSRNENVAKTNSNNIPLDEILDVEFSIYLGQNFHEEIFIVGEFNNWGDLEDVNLEKYKLQDSVGEGFYKVTLRGLKHGDEYLFYSKVNKTFKFDPATVYLSKRGNSVIWDFERKNAVRIDLASEDLIKLRKNLLEGSLRILQTELFGLVKHYRSSNQKGFHGKLGSEIPKKKLYKFIAESGVIDEICDLGFNAVQFLPLTRSIDGNNWKFRYLVVFPFAIDERFGTPDDFIEMINAFHKKGLGVIGDCVVSHFPSENFQVKGQTQDSTGLDIWKDKENESVYLGEKTSWGTKRPRYEQIQIRNFFIESSLFYLTKYGLDGLRIDNVDGILRHGDNGDGEDRLGGRDFLRELNSRIYNLNPYAIVNFEAHFFYDDNAKWLVAPLESGKKALGATAYNSSRLTYFFHTDFMISDVSKVNLWRIKYIAEEKEWGKSNSTIADFHNHDAASGLMEGRCTGSYCYDAMMSQNPNNHLHALGKIKVMEALIAFGTEGRILDLLQSFLLQMGSFEHDTSIHWYLTFNQASKALLNFKKEINSILENEAFWAKNANNRKFLNIDDTNKVIVIERGTGLEDNNKESKNASANFSNETWVIVINMSSWTHWNYKVGIRKEGTYKVIMNSDLFEFAGQGLISYFDSFASSKSNFFEFLKHEITLPTLPPYGVVILKLEK